MKTTKLWKAAAVAVAAGSVLAAGAAMAGGDKIRQDNGSAYGATPRTGTTATGVKQGDQTRLRLKDGSCQTSAIRQRDRLKDGSCQTLGDQTRLRLKDGSCQTL